MKYLIRKVIIVIWAFIIVTFSFHLLYAQNVVYTVPNMDKVKVTNITYKDDLTMDVYYPPNYNFEMKLPAVIFVTVAIQGLKDWSEYVSWGRLTAASGLIAITYDIGPSVLKEDTPDLLRYIQKNSKLLGIDKNSIGIWARSSNVNTALNVVMNKKYNKPIKCAVFYYGYMDVEEIRRDVPLFVVKSGKDVKTINDSIDQFVATARDNNVSLEFIEYEEGSHGFDTINDTDESREIIKKTLKFMKDNLLEK